MSSGAVNDSGWTLFTDFTPSASSAHTEHLLFAGPCAQHTKGAAVSCPSRSSCLLRKTGPQTPTVQGHAGQCAFSMRKASARRIQRKVAWKVGNLRGLQGGGEPSDELSGSAGPSSPVRAKDKNKGPESPLHSFMYSLSYSASFLSTHCVPGTALSAGVTVRNRLWKLLPARSWHSQGWDTQTPTNIME